VTRASAPPRLVEATAADAEALAALHVRVARDLTARFGRGHWSSEPTPRGVLWHLRISRIFIVKRRGNILATLRLTTRKPWAIDPRYFVAVPRPLYLVDMAVDPKVQRSGLGRACMAQVPLIAAAWPAQAVRLDAYDAPAGAGAFYRKCGYREVGRVTYRGVPLKYFELLLAAGPA
jgi:GNAT superfamily N-acetyltransferase